MTDVPTLRVDKYFYLSTYTGSLEPCPSFLVLFHPKIDFFGLLALSRLPRDAFRFS
jgi:hypothetical protein